MKKIIGLLAAALIALGTLTALATPAQASTRYDCRQLPNTTTVCAEVTFQNTANGVYISKVQTWFGSPSAMLNGPQTITNQKLTGSGGAELWQGVKRSHQYDGARYGATHYPGVNAGCGVTYRSVGTITPVGGGTQSFNIPVTNLC